MNQKLGHYNQPIGGRGGRYVMALLTELEHDLALVYIDEKVVLQTVPKSEYAYFIAKHEAGIDHVKEGFREAASRLGFDPAVEEYIGRVHADDGLDALLGEEDDDEGDIFS